MQIRSLQLADVAHILTVTEQLDLPRWDKHVLADAFSNGYFIVGLEACDRLLGFVICHILHDECHIMLIAVSPSQQGRGYGSSLLKKAVIYARERCCKSIELEVSCDNQQAISFYLGHDFQVVGRRKNYYITVAGRCDAVLMSLKLM